MEIEPIDNSPASLMASLTETIAILEVEIRDLEHSRSDARGNHTLTNKEKSILALGLDVLIVRKERELTRLQSKYATQRMKFQKETFWRNL